MAENIGELRAKFLQAYNSLPEPEIHQALVIIDDRPISWFKEISDKTALGDKILHKLKLLEIL